MPTPALILTSEEADNITKGVESGLSVKEIAVLYTYDMAVVKRVVEELGLADKLQNRAYWKWSEAEDALLCEEWNTKPDLAETAKLHKRSVGAVTTRVKQMRKNGHLPEDPKSAKAAKASKSRKYIKWSNEDIATLIEMVGDGLKWSDIALKIGRTYNAVYQKHQQLHPETNSKDQIEVILSCGDVTIKVSLPGKDPVNISIPKLDYIAQVEV